MKSVLFHPPVLAFTFCALMLPASSAVAQDAAAAFAAGDYATAQQLWTEDASAGSTDAMLGLAILADAGFLGTPDPYAAFGWYLQAAELGDPEAQFNVALGYDTGLGRDRDPAQALVWYTRSALRGYAEAQYNLGLIYESAEGGNADLARYWFDRSGTERSIAETPQPGTLAAPDIIFADLSAETAEIVWQAPATTDPIYELEVLEASDVVGYQSPVLVSQTAGSGLLIDDTALPDAMVWRVINLAGNGSDYRASAWQATDGTRAPEGRITFIVDDAVPGMASAADTFAGDLRAAGYWVRILTQTQDAASAGLGTYISYGFQADITLADRVARYLPGPAEGVGYVQQPEKTRPGEIIVYLAAKP